MDPSKMIWDYIIIGTGMGGGPIGLKLAQAGRKVLWIEAGHGLETTQIVGQYCERAVTDKMTTADFEKGGRWSTPIYDHSSGKVRQIRPFMGSGLGGSSALFGMVMERFAPHDFKTWPIKYEELLPYYEKAETLFKVKACDHFRHKTHEQLNQGFKKMGLNPYRLPLAFDDVENCQMCSSYICPKNCKNDSSKICINPALRNFGASLLSQCRAESLVVENGKVLSLIANRNGETLKLKAHHFILAAGALNSPTLLQTSNAVDPKCEVLGHNLMRHFVDVYVLKTTEKQGGPYSKEFGLNNFYHVDGTNYGTIQSFGYMPPHQVMLEGLRFDFKNNFSGIIFKGFQIFEPIIKLFLKIFISNRLALASIIEDAPRFENRVWKDQNGLNIFYHITPPDQERILWMRKKMKALLRNFKPLSVPQAEKNQFLAHVCGTCRMHDDPRLGVVNRNNQVHGVENLFVVDSSFFPTSAGTNPALTIAANSLRVADFLLRVK